MSLQTPQEQSPGESGLHPDPYQRPDRDRWLSHSACGTDGTGQIQVLHSVRKRRRIFALSAFGVTIGALLILFNSPLKNDFLAPGPLTSHHAQILAGMGGDRCAACHQAGGGSWLSWVGIGTSANGEACPSSQSELCLKCHQQSIPFELAANPHSLSSGQLQQLTEAQLTKFRLAGASLPDQGTSRQLACSACHVEHQGAMVDLTSMSDRQCQTCHAQRHQSFEQDHPDFALAGMQLPSSIRFDHDTHLKKYFAEGQQEFLCASCHVGDSERNVMRLASFDTMCGTCHAQTIRTTGQQGLVLLELPILDIEQMQAAGVELGEWPSGARGDFNGRLHPLTWALLYRKEKLREVLREFPAGFDFSEIEPSNETQLRRLGELVVGMKELLVELGSREFPEVVELKPFGAGAGSSLQFFRDSVAAWFPEMAAKGAVAQGERRKASSEPIWLPESAAVARWLQEQELLVPNPLAGKVAPVTPVEAAPAGSGSSQAALPAQPTVEAGPARQVPEAVAIRNPEQTVDSKSGREQALQLPPLRKGPEVPLAASSGDSIVLIENPLKKLAERDLDGPAAGAGTRNGKQTTDSIDNLGPQRTEHAPPHHSAVNQPEQAPAIEPVFSSPIRNQLPQPTLLRGWSRNDQSFKLVYYVAEHQDAFWPELYSWYEQLRGDHPEDSVPKEQTDREAALVLGDWLSQLTAAGACLSCHQPQSLAANRDFSGTDRSVIWSSRMRLPERKGFTRFNHAPHLLQLQCSQCHVPVEGEGSDAGKSRTLFASWKKSETGGVETSRTSDFAPIGRATCVQCHQRNQAPNSCTTCHAYHVDQEWIQALDCLR